jgi:hypothetical protein
MDRGKEIGLRNMAINIYIVQDHVYVSNLIRLSGNFELRPQIEIRTALDLGLSLLWWDYLEGGSKFKAHCLNFARVVKMPGLFPYKEVHVTF